MRNGAFENEPSGTALVCQHRFKTARSKTEAPPLSKVSYPGSEDSKVVCENSKIWSHSS